MQYRNNKNNEPISLLGYGCMRFTKRGTKIDIDKAEKEIIHAIEKGVNYFDTAYIYPDSEAVLGEIFSRNNCRNKINIATKLPQYYIRSAAAFDKYFNEQLRRLKTDYIDYYLMHMINDVKRWENLVNLGIIEWLEQKKSAGLIRNIGFSYHGNTENFIPLVDAYNWDFCMIQYNYMDEHSQAGRRGLQYAAAKNLPVIIMEPLRGGKLVNLLPESSKQIFINEGRGRSSAEWALRWLWNQPEVTCVLSGMNSIEMIDENTRIASEVKAGEFTDNDFALIEKIKDDINKKVKVVCTGCSYCMPCPRHVDIPLAFRCYNEIFTDSKRTAQKEYMQCTIFRKTLSSASQCIGCGKCEEHCPQHIEIRKELKNVSKALEGPIFKIARQGIKLLKLWSD
ncbi:MAG: aldo/keto reductase [Firmicutes bacterium]|nr:aldo/keto reductase [Bacillota bacterium]